MLKQLCTYSEQSLNILGIIRSNASINYFRGLGNLDLILYTFYLLCISFLFYKLSFYGRLFYKSPFELDNRRIYSLMGFEIFLYKMSPGRTLPNFIVLIIVTVPQALSFQEASTTQRTNTNWIRPQFLDFR